MSTTLLIPGSSSCSFHTWQSVLQGESE